MKTTTERKIIHIDKDKCNGCGICVSSCHEGAIRMVDGKAALVSDVYCDGLGDCLAPCPTGAITMVTREAEEYDPVKTAERQKELGLPQTALATAKPGQPCSGGGSGCPGMLSRYLAPDDDEEEDGSPTAKAGSKLVNWPLQLKLVSPEAPYFKNADILIAADCAAAASPDFHSRYIHKRPVILTCPKLDDSGPQILKLANIIQTARPASLTVLRMQVPCCGGLVKIAEQAIALSGLDIPLKTVVIDNKGVEL